MITDISIHNYKSLRNVELVAIPPLSIVVGANASGKSNFADALDFLSLVFREGLSHAIRTRGGYENICFRRARRAKGAIKFRVVVQENVPSHRGVRADSENLRFEYDFAFKARTEAITSDYVIVEESLTVLMPRRPKAKMHIRREGKKLRLRYSKIIGHHLGMPSASAVRSFLKERTAVTPEDNLVIPTYAYMLCPPLGTELSGCRVYQISPHMARQTGVPERSPELRRYGENLPAAVDYLRVAHKPAFDELLSHLSHTVPTMEKLETDYVETKQLGLFFTEQGVGRRWGTQDVSDGTLQTVALFLPLLDPRVRVVVIEEPENSVHPWILRHFMEVCKATSTKKQIILTTHSLVAVNEAPPETLFVTLRRRGETAIVRAADVFPEMTEATKQGLLGLGDYWDTGALDGVPQPEIIGDEG